MSILSHLSIAFFLINAGVLAVADIVIAAEPPSLACSDFENQQEAQAYFAEHPHPEFDPDGDGFPCESLPPIIPANAILACEHYSRPQTNLRSQPSTDSLILAELSGRIPMDVRSTESHNGVDWSRVNASVIGNQDTENMEGWIRSDLIECEDRI